MKKEIQELIGVIKEKNHHLLIVSGNIYDLVNCGSQKFSDTQDFLSELTKKKFPQLINYDLFSGISVARGDANEISAAMGLRQPEGIKWPRSYEMRKSYGIHRLLKRLKRKKVLSLKRKNGQWWLRVVS